MSGRFVLTFIGWTSLAAGASNCTQASGNVTSTVCLQTAAVTVSAAAGGVPVSAAPYPSIITIPPDTLSGAVSNVSLRLSISHSGAASDLGFLLVSPSGKALSFMGLGGNFKPMSNLDLTIDDSAGEAQPCDGATAFLQGARYKPTVCTDAGSWFGLFKGFPADAANGWPGCTAVNACPLAQPAGKLTLASVFRQETAPNGNWKLYVRDEASMGGGGTIHQWQLSVTTSGVASAGTAISLNAPSPATVLRSPPGKSEPVVLSAKVTSAGRMVNGGTVTFSSHAASNAICKAAVSNGVASCSGLFETTGPHSISAAYVGATSGLAPSASATPVNVMVHDRTTRSSITPNSGTFCSEGGIAMPAQGAPSVYPSNLFVTANGTPSGGNAFAGSITNLTVSVNGLSHATPVAIELLLVSPSGKSFLLLADAFQGNTPSAGSLVFSDSAGTPVPKSGAIVSGTFRPADYNTGTAHDHAVFANQNTLASQLWNPQPAPTSQFFFPAGNGLGTATLSRVFGGGSPNGTWRLYAVNAFTGGNGNVASWCLNFTVDPARTPR